VVVFLGYKGFSCSRNFVIFTFKYDTIFISEYAATTEVAGSFFCEGI